MRRVTVVILVAGLVGFIIATSALAVVKPKPWQWKPEKVVARLTAATPIMGGEIGSEILSARCTGQGRGVAGRFSRFACGTRWGSLRTEIHASTLSIRILSVGSGKLCVVTTTGVQGVPVGVPVAVPYTPGASWTPIRPERACP
jgi:hypothetical protein